MVAPESIDAIKQTPVGTGPFMFRDWVQGDSITLVAYKGYWGETPALTEATFKFISDPTAAFAAMMAQDIDAFAGFPAPENIPQFQSDPRFQVLLGTTEGETILAMNNARAPLDDPRVRAAIAHAIDRQAIIDGAMFGQGTPIGSHFAPHHPDYTDLTATSAHDPEAARQLLEEAGIAEGLSLSLKLPPPSYARRGGEILAAQLRAVGIAVEITNVEWAQWLEEVFRGKDFDLTIVSHTEPLDIGIYAREDYYFGYDSPEFREIMARFTASADAAERSDLLKQAQQRIAEDHVNGYLFQLAFPTVADARLRGLWQNQPTQANDLTGVSWAE
jgi:peptide/nickel transport system substrate-binding protein